jgi:biotin transport system substrate-specific component
MASRRTYSAGPKKRVLLAGIPYQTNIEEKNRPIPRPLGRRQAIRRKLRRWDPHTRYETREPRRESERDILASFWARAARSNVMNKPVQQQLKQEVMFLKASTMARVALMAALAAVGAQIAIPLPFSPVPFTLQVPAVILSGLLLGVRYGTLSQLVYLLLGAAGAPVFAQFSGGFAHLVGPTGGYLLSYPLAAAVAGLAAAAVASAPRPRALGTSLLAGTTALGVIYALGATWLGVVTNLPPAAALAQGVIPFVAFDLVKVALASLVAVAAAPQIAPSRA